MALTCSRRCLSPSAEPNSEETNERDEKAPPPPYADSGTTKEQCFLLLLFVGTSVTGGGMRSEDGYLHQLCDVQRSYSGCCVCSSRRRCRWQPRRRERCSSRARTKFSKVHRKYDTPHSDLTRRWTDVRINDGAHTYVELNKPVSLEIPLSTPCRLYRGAGT